MIALPRVPAALVLAGALLVAGCTSGSSTGPTTSPSVTATDPTTAPSPGPTPGPSAPPPSPTGAATVPLPTATAGGGAGTSDDGAAPAPEPTTTGSATPAPDASSSAPARALSIESPSDGDEVSSPVTLEVAVEGFELVEQGGSMAPTEGHLFAFVDVEPPQERVRLPESTSIVKSAEPTIDLGSLEPGEHTVTVLATHGYPVPFDPRVVDTVTFTVTG